jgi:hypothetical protein
MISNNNDYFYDKRAPIDNNEDEFWYGGDNSFAP